MVVVARWPLIFARHRIQVSGSSSSRGRSTQDQKHANVQPWPQYAHHVNNNSPPEEEKRNGATSQASETKPQTRAEKSSTKKGQDGSSRTSMDGGIRLHAGYAIASTTVNAYESIDLVGAFPADPSQIPTPSRPSRPRMKGPSSSSHRRMQSLSSFPIPSLFSPIAFFSFWFLPVFNAAKWNKFPAVKVNRRGNH